MERRFDSRKAKGFREFLPGAGTAQDNTLAETAVETNVAAAMNLPIQILDRTSALGLRPEDVDERFVRGAGPGGQKINKTSSTVWLRHRPTGLEVRCQQERSQWANRLAAWTALCEKIAARMRARADAAEQVREAERRRTRQKSRGQKIRMIETKKHRAKNKEKRGRVSW